MFVLIYCFKMFSQYWMSKNNNNDTQDGSSNINTCTSSSFTWGNSSVLTWVTLMEVENVPSWIIAGNDRKQINSTPIRHDRQKLKTNERKKMQIFINLIDCETWKSNWKLKEKKTMRWVEHEVLSCPLYSFLSYHEFLQQFPVVNHVWSL